MTPAHRAAKVTSRAAAGTPAVAEPAQSERDNIYAYCSQLNRPLLPQIIIGREDFLSDDGKGWVGSARRECLDQMLIADERHLWLVLGEYTDHYNGHRPHRSLPQDPPAGRLHPPVEMSNMRVLRRDRLGGFIREYTQVA